MPPDAATWPINNQLSADRDFKSLDIYLNRIAKENPTLNTNWWADYRRAQIWKKHDKNVSCENFSRLAQDMRFPLRRVAFLHAHEVCPRDNQVLERLEAFQVEQFEPWLTDSAVDVALAKAKALNDRTKMIEFFSRKSKASIRKEDKVALANDALKVAKKLGDKNKIEELQNRVYNLSPSQIPNPKPKDFLNVASDFRYLRKFDEARKYYQKVLSSKVTSLNEKLQAYRGLRLTYKIQQLRPEALKATEELAQFVERRFKASKKTGPDARLFVETELQLARHYWTENALSKANAHLTKIERQAKGRTSLSEVYWVRGRMAEERQDFTASIDWFRKALAEPIESQNMKDRLNWYLAWNERKAKKFDEAITILKDLKSRTENSYDRHRYQFWLAKTYTDKNGGDAKKSSEAQDEFNSLIKDDPLSFYALLSHRELGEALPAKKIKNNSNENAEGEIQLSQKLKGMIDWPYMQWLIATHETEIAKNYLDSIAKNLRKEAPSDIESWVSLFGIYSRSQNYLALFSQLNALDSSIRRALLEDHPQLMYPLPYNDTVTQAAGRFGVSPEFIYSIMRQESSFNPMARSQMDAFGLMQLLPEVAKREADANSIRYQNPEDLYEPFVNIPIGSAHLRELWDKYNGEIILAVASYNASSEAIANWVKTRYRGDTLEFIEDIPYDETRDYVKLVLRNLVTYELLGSRDDQMDFPEWTLKISKGSL